jgi:hypothetical protein
VEIELFGDILDRGLPAALPDVVGETLGVERVVGEKVELFALHGTATLALNPPHLDFQVHTPVAAGEIANLTRPPVVPTRLRSTTAAAGRFFERRSRVMTRALGSPKTPRTVGRGRKPGKAYASHSRRTRFVEVAMQTYSQFPPPLNMPESQHPRRFRADSPPQTTHTTS